MTVNWSATKQISGKNMDDMEQSTINTVHGHDHDGSNSTGIENIKSTTSQAVATTGSALYRTIVYRGENTGFTTLSTCFEGKLVLFVNPLKKTITYTNRYIMIGIGQVGNIAVYGARSTSSSVTRSTAAMLSFWCQVKIADGGVLKDRWMIQPLTDI